MEILSQKRCLIGEGPIWNEFDNHLYHVNGCGQNEICVIDIQSKEIAIRELDFSVAAIGFSKEGKILISCMDGAFYLNANGIREPLYDCSKYEILFGNDAKVGPDGRFYIGTQSHKRMGIGDRIDGKLYSIDKQGDVRVLLDGLILSNGFEWSMDEKYFYHADTGTHIIKEYSFDKCNGTIKYTGRQVEVAGVDGLTIDENNFLYVACWGKGHIAIIDTAEMLIKEHIIVPANIPASCAFVGENMDKLAVVTATLGTDIEKDSNAGYTFICKMETRGRSPFLFG